MELNHQTNDKLPRRIIRKPELQHRISLSDPTVWRLEQIGRFPKRIRLGGNSCGWFEDEIDDWMNQRSAERQSYHTIE
jgi:prophage regulatory protein